MASSLTLERFYYSVRFSTCWCILFAYSPLAMIHYSHVLVNLLLNFISRVYILIFKQPDATSSNFYIKLLWVNGLLLSAIRWSHKVHTLKLCVLTTQFQEGDLCSHGAKVDALVLSQRYQGIWYYDCLTIFICLLSLIVTRAQFVLELRVSSLK